MILDVPPVSELMTPMQFDENDLQANHDGQIGANQRIRLEGFQRRALLIGFGSFFGIGLLAAIFMYFAQVNDSVIFTFIGIMLTIINALMVGFVGRQWMQLAGDLRNNTVAVISGSVERVVQPDGRMNNFVLRVNQETFYVNKELFKLFRHETPYRLYCAPYSRVLLAAEPTD